MQIVKFGQKIKGNIIMTLGYMDCVHIGHRKLLDAAKRAAEFLEDFDGEKVMTAAFTFSNNPFTTLKKDILPIYDLDTRLRRLGTDYAVTAEFDEEFAALSADNFLDIIVETANIKGIVTGYDYRFSANAEKGVDYLKEYLLKRGISLITVETAFYGGEKVSSSEIRRLIKDGKIKEANALLGSSYMVSGTAVHGTHTGATLGFPTVNILPKDGIVRLKEGVYVTKTQVDGKVFGSLTNAGGRPTFDGNGEYIFETYINGINRDLYGKYIEIEFLERIRDIVKFNDRESLIRQLEKDKERIIYFRNF
ncbi:MAG: riboflavin biosynthesis protein RibF [Clostridiales bacterium]|nr:riboflavin biosynthesis protein RibF [Clostridiales bacterium]